MSSIRLVRVCAPQYANSPEEMLNGKGSFQFGGRWNSPGSRVVYLSESLSLAAFEILVHAQSKQLLEPYRFLEVFVPEDLIMALDDEVLPENWMEPFNYELQTFGDSWVASGASLGLSLPSAVVPGERNVILCPDHPDFGKITYGEIQPFTFDPRIVNKD
ncbi:RES family NAD+ phosphorylase [Marinobacter mobilis]|uniref:RES family NAD+ phosphorylase n=1 Tax=Marinobacter mobilis TaxID=488533 RepID=UPI0035C6AD07